MKKQIHLTKIITKCKFEKREKKIIVSKSVFLLLLLLLQLIFLHRYFMASAVLLKFRNFAGSDHRTCCFALLMLLAVFIAIAEQFRHFKWIQLLMVGRCVLLPEETDRHTMKINEEPKEIEYFHRFKPKSILQAYVLCNRNFGVCKLSAHSWCYIVVARRYSAGSCSVCVFFLSLSHFVSVHNSHFLAFLLMQ